MNMSGTLFLCCQVAQEPEGWGKDLALVIVGWVGGIGSYLVTEWFRRRGARREMAAALTTELRGLRFRMAIGALRTGLRTNQLRGDFLVRLKALLSNLEGLEEDREAIELARTFTATSEQDLATLSSLDANPGGVLTHMHERIHLLESRWSDVGLFDSALRERIARLSRLLEFYNDDVSSVRDMRMLSFQLGSDQVYQGLVKEDSARRVNGNARRQLEVAMACDELIRLLSKFSVH